MKDPKNINYLIEMLKDFIAGSDCSLEIAGKIEVTLDDIFPEDEEIQDYVTMFASYTPRGGEYLYDEERMVNESKKLLEVLNEKVRKEPVSDLHGLLPKAKINKKVFKKI
jgi:hypothetical protein